MLGKDFMVCSLVLIFFAAGAQAVPIKVLMHAHVSDLDGDDGMGSSLALFDLADSQGYNAIIMTPHTVNYDGRKNDSATVNALVREKKYSNLSLVIMGGEVEESGAEAVEFGDVRVWVHPGYPELGAAPQKSCGFYEICNGEFVSALDTGLFTIPANSTDMMPLVGEDFHGIGNTLLTAIIVDAENQSEPAIISAKM